MMDNCVVLNIKGIECMGVKCVESCYSVHV